MDRVGEIDGTADVNYGACRRGRVACLNKGLLRKGSDGAESVSQSVWGKGSPVESGARTELQVALPLWEPLATRSNLNIN